MKKKKGNSTQADPSAAFDGVALISPSLPYPSNLEVSHSTKGDLRGHYE